jgi:hypothetical protein
MLKKIKGGFGGMQQVMKVLVMCRFEKEELQRG